MAELDFESILSKTAKEIPEASLVPTGTWRLKALAVTTAEADVENERPARIAIAYMPVEPGEDVDPDEVEKGLWKGERVWFEKRIEKESDFNAVTKHLELLGIPMTAEDLSFEEGFKRVKKSKPEIFASVGSRSYKTRAGDEKWVNTVKDFMPVE